MVRRRDRTDPELAARLRERLAALLSDDVPRRANLVPAAGEPGASQRWVDPDRPRFDPIAPYARPELGAPPVETDDEDAELRQPAEPEIDVLDESWRPPPGRRRFRRAHVGVVVAMVLVALLVAGWLALRARPVALAGPLTTTVPTTATSRSAGGTTPEAASVKLVVHVLGAVRHPGVVSLADRSRVRDAIEAAGGLDPRADPGELNLAQVLADGQQVVIGTRKHPGGEVRDGSGSTNGEGTSPTTGGATAVVDLNRATAAQLEELPGVGPVTAGKIVAWRTEHQRFSRVEELQEVDGIGPKTYAQIAPHVRV